MDLLNDADRTDADEAWGGVVSDTFVCPVCGLVRDDTDAHQSGPNDPVVCSDCFVPAVSTMTEAEFKDLVVEVFAREAVIV